jgi:four helix bundle protein
MSNIPKYNAAKLAPNVGKSQPNTQKLTPNTQDLEVWKVSHNAVLQVYQLTKLFPGDERFRLVDQLCRAAASVPANIAEGKGRSSLREYVQFLSIARGSVEEVKYFLLLARDLKYLDQQDYDGLANDYDHVGKMLNGLMTSLRTHLPQTQNLKSKTKNP